MPDRGSLVLIFISCCILSISSSDVRLPPSITHGPVEYKIFRNDDEIQLDCVASGYPKPQYEWRKDGQPLLIPGPRGNVYWFSTTDGTILIKMLTLYDEGTYQCIAFNPHGKTMSQPAVLQRAVLGSYGPDIPVFQSPIIKEGEPYKLNCLETKVFPKPTYSWSIFASTGDPTPRNIVPDRRVQIDDIGNLYFSYVMASDAHDGKTYKCNVYNPNLDVTMGGSYSVLNIQPAAPTPVAPAVHYSSPPTVVALEGKNVTLKCLFSGYPDIQVAWFGEPHLNIRRYPQPNMNTELVINDVQLTDAGSFTCRGSNSVNYLDNVIRVQVEAIPVFRSLEDRPHNVNVTEGDNVTMRCSAYAKPNASVTWYINGDVLNIKSLPSKFQISEDHRVLTIRNVCKTCGGGTSSDIQVIQCTASNEHGAAFGDGYINVLEKTVIAVAPEDVTVTSQDRVASFNCSGISDDSTPINTTWYRYDKDEGRYLSMHADPEHVFFWQNGSMSIQMSDNNSNWKAYQGQYRCNVSNNYSMKSAEVRLEYTDSEIGPTVEAAGFPWWILLIVLILLLLLLLICCCWFCLKRNQGETYPVDEKERKTGHDPEKELADSGFHDYIRPENMNLKASQPSLGSSKKTISDDEMSLNEYGDIDAGKFTEDGSFIGDYGNHKDYNGRDYV